MKGLTRVRWFAYAVAVSLAFAAPAGQFRSLTVTTQTTYGSVMAFDLAIGPSAGTNPLYIAWGASDGGETTAGWDHVEKLQDVGPAAATLTVPISRLPEWGTDACKAVRFLFLPGDMYVPLQNFKAQGAMISADYRMNSRDEARCKFKLTTTTSQYGAHLFGYKKNWENQFYCCYAGGAQMAGGVCYNNGAGSFKTTDTVHAYSQVICEAVVSAAEVSFYTNGVLHQQSTTGYSGDEFTVNGDCTLFHSDDYVPQSGYQYLNTYFYSFTVTRDGERMIDFIPCKTNGIVCVYDAARQRFFGTTNGTFTAGSVVEGAAASSLVSWRESEAPHGTFTFTRLSGTTVRISGTLLSAGVGATKAEVYLYHAPHGEPLPDVPISIQVDIPEGGAFTRDLQGLATGVAYDYAIFYRNDLEIPQVPSRTGTINAASQIRWTGGGSSDWFDIANWDRERIPSVFDDVTIPAGASLLLTNATPPLYRLEIAGTLTMSNWLTKVEAGSVTIRNGGTVTCVGPFTDAEMSNRVWIVCTDLAIDAGGAIDVNDKGYAGGPAARTHGSGPSYGHDGMGAGHGGFGGGALTCGYRRPIGSDDPADPQQPGSGGTGGANDAMVGREGGGAVKIDATGRVTVNGTISASATKASAGTYSSCGAGGAISIGCASFAGVNGTIVANGPVSANTPPAATTSNGSTPGGGGMIAIRTTAQTDGLVSGMTISVREGLYKNTGLNAQDVYCTHADLGTLYFTDARLLESLGRGISGQILNLASYSCENLEMTGGHVRFTAEGFVLNVSGDLTVDGTNARLELGGAVVTNRTYDLAPFCGTTPVELAVGGNLKILNGGRLDVYSAMTNGVGSVGARIGVTGTMTVGASSKVTAACDEVNGGTPVFTVGNLTVEEGGLFSADARGFAGGTSSSAGGPDKAYKGKGPGGGNRIGTSGNVGQNKYIGGGYGGIGGWSEAGGSTSGLSYGDEWCPSLPGSGGAGQTWTSVAGAGGGVIDVTAAGTIRIDGTVSANGGSRYTIDQNVGGGSGGSIWLKAPVFSGAATGVITANGQSRTSQTNGGAGGGGRIAIWTGSLPYDGNLSNPRVHMQVTPFTMKSGLIYAGMISAAGGTNSKEASGDADGTDGSVWFVNVDKQSGLMLLLR